MIPPSVKNRGTFATAVYGASLYCQFATGIWQCNTCRIEAAVQLAKAH